MIVAMFCRPLALGVVVMLALLDIGCRQGTVEQPDVAGTKNEGSSSSAAAKSDPCCADGIAVIDLGVLANEIGATELINESIQKREQELLGKLDEFRNELEDRVAGFKEKNPESEEGDGGDLDKLLADNKARLALQAQAAQSHLATHLATLQQKLFDDVRPVAWRIAKSRGLSVVMTTSQIYAALPERDITQAVVEEIRRINAANADKNSTDKGQTPSGTRFAEMPGGGSFLPR